MKSNRISKSFKPSCTSWETIFDIAVKEKRLQEIEAVISKGNLWDDPTKAKPLLKERAQITQQIEPHKTLSTATDESALLLDMAEEESDAETVEEVSLQVGLLKKKVKNFSITVILNGEDDPNHAIISINAGAGGTEAQDWAEMLFRMYSRWIEGKGFKLELIDMQPGEEAGIKSVTFSASGEYAYGYLKTEIGVHRLVRISPFNASGKRHTSFASVFVYPDVEDEIVIDIEEKDLRIDVFRASGAGGQHVNKTSSAVRITHLPTGIVVQCQQEKSQFRNKDLAMKVLRARLYQHEKEKQNEKLREIHEGKDDIAWGNQIRSYVLQPYQLVKDHRINLEVGNVTSVLDGNIDPFIEGVLLKQKAH